MTQTQLRILVADDSRTVRAGLRATLSALPGVYVHAVENGAEALKELSSGKYALLVSDIEMPLMTGMQLLRVVRAQLFSGADLPIIMLTREHRAEQKRQAFADGANDYVTKPVDPVELLARVEAQLAQRTVHRESLANQAVHVHAQKLASVAQLAATLAHELNTPAQYLGDNLAFLTRAWNELQSPELVADRAAYLRTEIPNGLRDMREGLEQITKFIETIAEFAQPDRQEASQVELARCINTVVDLLRSRWLGVVELTTHHGSQVGHVHCAQSDLKHALWQLIADAIDAASAPGDVKGQVNIATRRDGDRVVLSVRATRRAARPVNTIPPPNDDGLRVTRAVLQKHQAKLDRQVEPDGSVTSVLTLAC